MTLPAPDAHAHAHAHDAAQADPASRAPHASESVPQVAAVGLDVGGGSLKIGVLIQDQTGALLEAEQVPGLEDLIPRRLHLPESAPAAELDAICARSAQQMAAAVLQRRPELGVRWGVAAAAWIRPDDGHSIFSPHLPGWRNYPLRERLARQLSATPGPLRHDPVVINDADAAGWAEAHRGAGPAWRTIGEAGPHGMVLVAIGTGIGGAWVRDGVVETGTHGMAGEYGHLSLDPQGEPCPCGSVGCWETVVSASALAARAGRTSARTVIDDALAGDPRCVEAVEETGRWLGRGLSMLTAALDPDLMVIGGGVSSAGELLLGPARAELERTLPGSGHRPAPPVVTAQLGNQAGWQGAAGVVLRPAPRRRDLDHDGPSPAAG